MKQQVTTAIVLNRINYGEADKIITVLTPNQGKLKLIAKSVRKIKSKLAGSVELFSVSSLTFVQGKKEISTLISGRLQTYFSNITDDYARSMIGYDMLKIINKSTKDSVDSEYYNLLLISLNSLNKLELKPLLVKCWFMTRQLKLLGHELNTARDINNNKLLEQQSYGYDFKEMSFCVSNQGQFKGKHIKLLRLLAKEDLAKLNIIANLSGVLGDLEPLLNDVLKVYKVS